MKKFALILMVAFGLVGISSYMTACPAPTTTEKTTETAAEKAADATTGD